MNEIKHAFAFDVEWEDGYLYISEEDGSGAKYLCETLEQVSTAIYDYINMIQVDKEAETIIAMEDEMIAQYELNEKNREY